MVVGMSLPNGELRRNILLVGTVAPGRRVLGDELADELGKRPSAVAVFGT
jgi:hypothetical protein